MTIEQQVEVAICCALAMEPTDEYRAWAERWLSGEDRTIESARAAEAAAWAEDEWEWASAAAWVATRAAARAAEQASRAAWAEAAAAQAIDIARNAGIDVDAIAASVEGKA